MQSPVENAAARTKSFPHKELSVSERNAFFDSLCRMGNFYELANHVDTRGILIGLKQFEDQWVQYNPYKPKNPRFGLSVTSLDGKLGGKPDLYSLKEYFNREGFLHAESDFRAYTEVYDAIPALQNFLRPFEPFLGRTHFLRFNSGGHFPPHRDSAAMEAPDTFRIIVPIAPQGTSSHVFMLDGKKLEMREARPYFLNTLLPHSIFSFSDGVTYLICNIILHAESVRRIKSFLLEK